MSRVSLLKESDLVYSGLTDNLEPIVIQFPITETDLELTLEGIQVQQTHKTMQTLREIEHKVPKLVIFRSLLLGVTGILLFYLFIVLITLTLFNLVLMLIFLILFINYLKWMYKSLKTLRNNLNMQQIKKFLDNQNQRFYSSRLLRFQLYQLQKCIKILNLRFWQ